jgi:transposase
MKRVREGYQATNVSKDVRQHLGRVAHTLYSDGMSQGAIANLFARSGSPSSRATVGRWVRQVEAGEPPLKVENNAGNEKSLSDEQRMALAGWVLWREDQALVTSLPTVVAGANWMFKQPLSLPTASRYMDEFDLSWKLTGSRPEAKQKTKEELVTAQFEWLLRYHQEGFGSGERRKLWCIDGVTDREKNQRVKSIGRRNGTQRKVNLGERTHVSTLLVMCNAEGFQVGPGVFTFNEDLNLDGPNGGNVRRFMKQEGLDPKFLYYVPSQKSYCKESRDAYYTFLNATKPWEGHRVLSDKSTIFRVDGEDFFEDIGFEQHRTFVPETHGPASMQDGFMNSWAKNGQRSRVDYRTPQWQKTLMLAHEFIHIPPVETARAWERHMLVGATPTREQVEQFLFPKEGKDESRQNLWDKCIATYHDLELEDGWDDHLDASGAVPSGLDGMYWK